MATKNLHVLSLQADNFQRLTAIRIDPGSGLNIIAGDNEQGKSSTLDALELLLRGKSVMAPEPIKRGSRKATIKAEIGTSDPTEVHFEIERIVTAGGLKLKVTPKAGTIPEGGDQTFLSSLSNTIAFDPFAFITMEAKKQDELLRKIAGVDTKKLDDGYKMVFDARTDANKLQKQLEARLDAMPPVVGAPDEQVSTLMLMAVLEDAQKINQENETMRLQFAVHERSTAELAERVREGEAILAKLRAELTEKATKLTAAKKTLDESLAANKAKHEEIAVLVDVDTNDVKKKIATAAEQNELFTKHTARVALKAEIDANAAKVEKYNEALESLKQEKLELLTAAKFPVPGLGIDDEIGVTFDGIALAQASTSQKIRVSMAIAAALNPTLRVVLVRNGNDVDKKKLQVIAETAREMGLQVLMERIEPGQGVPCFIIEDGEIVSIQKGTE